MSSGFRWNTIRKSGLLTLTLTALVATVVLGIEPVRAQTPGASAPADENRAMELQRYRDAVRRHFVLKQYGELLELTEKYGHLYPEDEGTEFYRTQAEIRLEEAERKIPFARLEDREFKIPEAPEGEPSLLDELRKGAVQTESGLSGDAGDLMLEPAEDSRIAMGLPPIDEELPLPAGAPDEIQPDDPSMDEPASTVPPRDIRRDVEEVGAIPRRGVEEEAEPVVADEGSSPLLMILGGSAVVLGAIAAFLLVGLLRRGRSKEAVVAEATPAAAMPTPPAPPLFNFDDGEEAPTSGDDTFGGTELPDPFSETATPGEAQMDVSAPADSDFGDAPEQESLAPAGLGDTRSADVNQEISDLLYSPESGSVGDSAFDAPADPIEIPPPLGETQTQHVAFGGEGQDVSDLVQLPDEDVSSASAPSDADVDSLFAEASHSPEPAPAMTPEPAPVENSSADLSSIDLFADSASGQADVEKTGATDKVGLGEIDESMQTGADSASADFSLAEASDAGPAEEGIDIPFALEDPFQNLSGASHEASGAEDETAFNTSTAEGMAHGGAEADTGADERELLQIIEEGGGQEISSGVEADSAVSGEDSGVTGEDSGVTGEELWSDSADQTAEPSTARSTLMDETDSVISFQEDQTAVVEFDDGGTAEEPTHQPGPSFASPEAETVAPKETSDTGGADLPNDPFERERHRGFEALAQEDWSKAVYHLSIAASLQPDAGDVREELRRARKMKKEQQTS